MALTTYPITGDLKDALGGDSLIGEVTLTPYGSHDARVDGANALLGAISYDLDKTEAEGGLPATLDLTAGAWIITIRAKGRVQGEQQFKTIQHVIDHQAATTWGAIVSGAVSSPPMTPTLVQQAQDAATAAEASATTASADAAAADQARADAEAAAATATAPTDSMVASLAADPASATGAELRETFASRDVYPEAVRIGRKIPIGATAAWAQQAGTGTVTSGTDSTHGDYARIANTTAGGSYRVGRDLPMTLDGTKAISFMVRRNDANLSVFDLFAVFEAFGTDPYHQWNKSASGLDVGVWKRVVVSPAEWDSRSGTPPTDLTDFRTLSIRVTPTSGTTTSVDIADIRVHDIEAPARLAIQFDDGHSTTYDTAYPLLAARGWAGGIAVEHTNVGGANRCTLAQLQEMYAAGWSMHGHHTTQMTTLTTTDQIAVHRASQAFLHDSGFTRGDGVWVWPGGARDTTAEEIALRYWRTCRRVGSFTRYGAPHIYDPVDPPVAYFNTSLTLAAAKDRVDRAVAAGGATVLVFHAIVPTTSAAEDWSTADFTALLDHIAAKDCVVVPPSDIWTR